MIRYYIASSLLSVSIFFVSLANSLEKYGYIGLGGVSVFLIGELRERKSRGQQSSLYKKQYKKFKTKFYQEAGKAVAAQVDLELLEDELQELIDSMGVLREDMGDILDENVRVVERCNREKKFLAEEVKNLEASNKILAAHRDHLSYEIAMSAEHNSQESYDAQTPTKEFLL